MYCLFVYISMKFSRNQKWGVAARYHAGSAVGFGYGYLT